MSQPLFPEVITYKILFRYAGLEDDDSVNIILFIVGLLATGHVDDVLDELRCQVIHRFIHQLAGVEVNPTRLKVSDIGVSSQLGLSYTFTFKSLQTHSSNYLYN